MSQSTDAILAFGFDLGEIELEDIIGENDDGDDFETWLATRAGFVYPAGHAGIESSEYRAFSVGSKAAVAACPVELVTHCSYDYSMYFLALRGTVTTASRGSPKAISLDPPPSTAQVAAMRAFCEEHGIEWQEPQWHIFSMWG